MAQFDPEKFEDKYVHYLTELQQAYRNAFEYMNDRYDSELVHAIDQGILNESEPFYEGEGAFRIELPENPHGRLGNVLIEEEKLDAVLAEYVDRLEMEIRNVFGLEKGE
jgi:hypothetical protein